MKNNPLDMKDALPVLELLGSLVTSDDLKESLKIVRENVESGTTWEQLVAGIGMGILKRYGEVVVSCAESLKSIATDLHTLAVEAELTREAITENTKAIYNHTSEAFHETR